MIATANTAAPHKPSRRRFALMTAATPEAAHTHPSLAPNTRAIEESLRSKLAAELRQETAEFMNKFAAEVESVRRELEEHDLPIQEPMQGLQALVADLADRLQGIARGQATPPLGEVGLEIALEKYCQHVCNVTRIELSFESHIQEERIDPGNALMAFRIAQDALDHATRYRQPNFVSVKLSQDVDILCVQVEDLGEAEIRKSPEAEAAEKLFLERMEERMADCAGELQVSRGADSTLVSLQLPLETPRSARAAAA